MEDYNNNIKNLRTGVILASAATLVLGIGSLFSNIDRGEIKKRVSTLEFLKENIQIKILLIIRLYFLFFCRKLLCNFEKRDIEKR